MCVAQLTPATFATTMESIIFDTDISSDVDDVGALALLHTLANKREAKILATMVSSGNPLSPVCLNALNTYFGRPQIPIGVVRNPKVSTPSKYAKIIAEKYTHSLKSAQEASDAVDLYRRVLAAQPDKSVVIVTTGYLTNIADLLRSGADRTGSLDGITLAKRKVKRLVCMGGQYPRGREWNFYQDAASARYVVSHWPGAIVYCGFEIGVNVMTGAGFKGLPSNPVGMSYALYNGLNNRPSWDQITVLVAVRGLKEALGSLWGLHITGTNHVMADGSNNWRKGPAQNQAYLISKSASPQAARLIEKLMIESLYFKTK